MSPPPEAESPVPVALTVAGSDPSGGAGIQADLKTFSALGVYGAAVVTALTAQNTRGVTGVLGVPADFVAAQLEAVLDDLRVGAVKLGMLGEAATVEAVAATLSRFATPPVVLDPVMVAKGGAALLAPDAVAALKTRLLPLCHVVTPNLPEAARLLDDDEAAIAREPGRTCVRLHALGARAVLLKGGHATDEERSDDVLFDGQRNEWLTLPAPRIHTRNTHGTGCTLSAAIAARLAAGLPLFDAVREAKQYLHAALAAGAALSIQKDLLSDGGHGPVHHFYAAWPSAKKAARFPSC